MALESPLSVLFNSEGFEIALSQSQVISASAQPGLVMAGSGSDGRAYFFRVSNDGSLFITGAIQTSAVATQSVQVADWLSTVTGNVKLNAWGTNVTGAVNLQASASIIMGGWATGVTGNHNLAAWGTNVTGAVNLQASASVIVGGWTAVTTASTREIGAATTLVSSANASVTNFILLSPNASRAGATFYKEGSNTCYLKLGSTATATSYTVRLSNNGYYELPSGYTGRADILFSTAAAGNVLYVTEITVP